jgi:hypothetical protein
MATADHNFGVLMTQSRLNTAKRLGGALENKERLFILKSMMLDVITLQEAREMLFVLYPKGDS